MTISAQIIKDSISPAGIRLITYQLRYPRFIHASPLEHQATPDYWRATVRVESTDPRFKKGWANPDLHGNFFGWCQWRKYNSKENINQRDWDESGQRFVDWTWESKDGAG